MNQLWYLHLVIAKGSFKAAAREAGVSQPAISQAMRALQERWETPLFEKVGRCSQPTPFALLLAEHAGHLHARLEGLTRLKSADSQWSLDRDAATLRVGLAPAAALLYGTTIENAWHQHAPDGLIQIVSGGAPELLSALHARELDLVIAPRPRRHKAGGVKSHLLHTSTPAVYARTGHPLGSSTSLGEIESAGWAVAGRAGTPGNVIEEALRVHRRPKPRILAQCADYTTLLTLVANSDLLCVVPHPALIEGRQDLGVHALRVREGLPLYDVCLFWIADKGAANREAVDLIVLALKSVVEAPKRPGMIG